LIFPKTIFSSRVYNIALKVVPEALQVDGIKALGLMPQSIMET
jgi:hypothetical protein